jgi:hypothetical protein
VTVWLALAVVVVVVAVLARARWWPYQRCWWCRGRPKRGAGSTKLAYNRCRFCGGKGEQIRPLARIWKRHRDEARRLKNERSK